MFPKEHIILGLMFSLVVKFIFPQIEWFYIILIFVASFMIDFDHYAMYVKKTGNFSPVESVRYYYKRIAEAKRRGEVGAKAKKSFFFLFHTLEFHILILLMSYFWIGFLYIFIGMVFHSFLDIVKMSYKKELHTRWLFLIEWILDKNKV